MKNSMSVIGLLSLLLILSPALRASYSDADLAQCTANAKVWLGLIDNADFENSYAKTSEDFQKRVTHDKWAIILKSLRTPLGQVTDRKLLSHDYMADGLDGDDGEHIILHYDTTFSDSPTEQLETVTFKRYGDRWMPVGYAFQAKPDNAN